MKRNLLKVIGISFLLFVILSWIIPVGTYSGTEFSKDGIDAVGLFDLVGVPVQTILTFALYIVVFACIGGLYGVMAKSGALDAWTGNVTRKFTGKEKRFLVFTIIFFVILSSVTGLMLPLFVLVPFFAIVLFALNYDKVTALAATVGAILVGSIGSTYGFNITGYTKNILSLDMNSQILAKVIILVLLTAVLIFFALRFSERKNASKSLKKEDAVKTVEKAETKKSPAKKTTKSSTKKSTAKTTTRKTTKKSTRSTTKNMAVSFDVKKVSGTKKISTLPLIIIFALMFIITCIGMYNWYYSFSIDAFSNIHDAIMKVSIGGFPIFEHLLSGITQLGYWGNNEFIIMMVIAAILIAFVYRISFNDFVESFIAGVKKMLPTAIYAALASVILTVLYQALSAGGGTLVDTMFNTTMGWTSGFNVLTTGITALYGSFFYNDLYYLLSTLQPYIAAFDANMVSVAGLLVQAIYSLGMLIFPTSVILIAGLSYFDVSYKEWMKYIWKFALVALAVLLIVCAILALI